MDCERCKIPVGDKVRITFLDDSCCQFCGVAFGFVAITTYIGLTEHRGELVHQYRLDNPVPCSECGANLNVAHLQCGNNYLAIELPVEIVENRNNAIG